MPPQIEISEREFFTIAEMAGRYGVTLRALRFYEQQGLLKPTRCGTQRLYSARDRVRLQLILTGKRLQFTLREIDALILSHRVDDDAVEPGEIVSLLDKPAVDARLNSLQQQKEDIEATISELKALLK